nr:hypothetical protein [Cressdnaviricota sp.]
MDCLLERMRPIGLGVKSIWITYNGLLHQVILDGCFYMINSLMALLLPYLLLKTPRIKFHLGHMTRRTDTTLSGTLCTIQLLKWLLSHVKKRQLLIVLLITTLELQALLPI